MTTLVDIGQAIRQSRTSRGLKTVELAARAGVSRNTLGALEAGRGNVELNTLLALLDGLGLDLQFMPRQIAEATPIAGAVTTTGLQAQVGHLMRLTVPRVQRKPVPPDPASAATKAPETLRTTPAKAAIQTARRATPKTPSRPAPRKPASKKASRR